MTELILYYIPTCPFCRKVINYINQNGISVTMKNRNETAQARNELLAIGGKSQVPCLVVHNKALYESDDIIQWLDKNLKRKE